MNALRLAILAPFVALLASACGGRPGSSTTPAPVAATKAQPAAPVLEPFQCGNVQRIHSFGDIFLASQPTPADFEHAQKNGIKTVVNMRHHAEIKDFDEPALVARLGLAYVNLPWNGPDELTDQVFDRGRELLSQAERPLMLHCSSANRIGPIWIAWRVLDGKVAWEQAHAEAVQIGMKTPAYTDKAKAYVERRLAKSPAGS
ncbi:MAG: sulfur transferase domain-containing protein [Planctomycetota bacterium]